MKLGVRLATSEFESKRSKIADQRASTRASVSYMSYSVASGSHSAFGDKTHTSVADTFAALYWARRTWAYRDSSHSCHNHQAGGSARIGHMPELIRRCENGLEIYLIYLFLLNRFRQELLTHVWPVGSQWQTRGDG